MSAQLAPAQDRYPSRVGQAGGFVPREDPVLWGRPQHGDGPLSAEQMQRFDTDGFVVVEDAIDAETVTACLTELADLEADPAQLASELAITEPDDGLLRSLFDVHRGNGPMASLATDDRLATVARQLLGGDVYLHQSRVNLKRGGGKTFPWHSDFETWHVEDGMPAMRAVSASVALTENRAWNGPLLLIAGSHRWFLSFPGRTPDDNHRTSLKRQTYGVPQNDDLAWLTDRGRLDVFEGDPGSVVFFDCNVMHGSPDNITPAPRTNAFFCYNAVDNALVEPFGGTEPRPNHIASRQFTGV